MGPYIWSFLLGWLHPYCGSSHMILFIWMATSMPWIHTHDPFYSNGCVHVVDSCIVRCLLRDVSLGIFILEISAMYIVSCLICRSPNGVFWFLSLTCKAFHPSLPILASCFRGNLLYIILSHFLSHILKYQNDENCQNVLTMKHI